MRESYRRSYRESYLKPALAARLRDFLGGDCALPPAGPALEAPRGSPTGRPAGGATDHTDATLKGPHLYASQNTSEIGKYEHNTYVLKCLILEVILT